MADIERFLAADNEKKSNSGKLIVFFKILLFTAAIIFMTNLNALVDLYLHPQIPYLDDEHLIVGSITGLVSLMLGIIIYTYINRLHRINRERGLLLTDLSLAILKAEESERLKSSFLANMSHEIRTPLNGILGFASLLEGPGLTLEEQQEFLKVIQKSGNRMLNIINEIIDISKIESGTMEVKYTAVDVNEKVDTVFKLFDRSANKKGIHLSVEKSLSDENAVVKADKD